MNATTQFYPPRQKGIVLHASIIVVLLIGALVTLFLASDEQQSGRLLLWLSFSLVCLLLLPVLIYRGYSLLQARYIMERNGVRLRWGLWAEDIPLNEIEWVRPADEMVLHLKPPFFSMPGAILGSAQDEDLGKVEFAAAGQEGMLLIATSQKVYVITPSDLKGFMTAFRRMSEMGSLTPLESYSSRPAFFLRRVWGDKGAKGLILAGFGLTTALIGLVITSIPGLKSVSLGFDIYLQPWTPGAPERLLLLPVLCLFVFVLDLSVGLYFFRRSDTSPIAYLLWGGGIVTPALLILATFFMI